MIVDDSELRMSIVDRLQEKHVLEMQCKHQRNILELQEKLKLNLQQVCRCPRDSSM